MKHVVGFVMRATVGALLVCSLPACGLLHATYEPPENMMLASDSNPGLFVQFFGVTTMLISDGETSIMVDGFFSRPGPLRLLLPLRPNRSRIEHALEKGTVGKIDAVLVSHAHYDHAMDAPILAKDKNALLIGSQSTAYVASREKLDEAMMCVLEDREARDIGRFRVTLLATPHSCGKPRNPGTLDAQLPRFAWMNDYKPGQNYSFLIQHPKGDLLIVTSANLRGVSLNDVRADVVFLVVGHLADETSDEIGSYWAEAVETTKAKLVIPVHWDDFITRSLRRRLKGPWVLDDVAKAMGEIERHWKKTPGDGTDKVELKFLRQFERVALPLYDHPPQGEANGRRTDMRRKVLAECPRQPRPQNVVDPCLSKP